MSEQLKLQERILTGIELGESHFREFKTAFEHKADGILKPRAVKDLCRDIGEVLVAFANADGGELFIGVEDDGMVTGIPHKDDHIEAMKMAYTNYVHSETPLPKPSIRKIESGHKIILYFQISKSTTYVHLTSDSRCLQRFDRENRPVTSERVQYDRQEIISREFDRNFLQNATLNDLDIELLESIAYQLASGYSPEKLLQLLDLAEYGVDGLTLRRAALLLFAKDVVKWHPRCAVRIIRINGTEMGVGHDYNVVEDDVITNNIITILESAWNALRPHLARTKFQANALFRESIIYPEEACREALINAVAHRDYSIEGKPIEILIYDDRMEVRSPGRLLSSIQIQDLKELKGSHQSRNVFIARVLRELGYMREMGEGIKRIFSSVRTFELVDPDISTDFNTFVVTLFHKSIFSPKDVQWLHGFSDFSLTKDEQRIVLLGRDGRLLSSNDIIETLGIVDTEDFRAFHEQLNRKGIIYSAKPPSVRGKKRLMPRFQIRPPQEAQQYLAELQKALYEIGPIQKFDRDIARKLREKLSPNSPYYREPVMALRALGYISEMFIPLPLATSIWSRIPMLTSKLLEAKRELGLITYLAEDKGYGFIQATNGEDFFVHISDLLEKKEWKELTIGTNVEFQIGERNIPGKVRPAKAVKIIR